MCLICDRINMIKNGTNPYLVKELKTGYVVIGDNQHFKGYTLFLYKHHETTTELFHLNKQERALFMEEMTLVAQAVSKAFNSHLSSESRKLMYLPSTYLIPSFRAELTPPFSFSI